MPTYKHEELVEIYESMCLRAVVECTFTSTLVGGQPADENGLRLFCKHHLHLEGKELEAAIERIRTQEIGETEKDDDADEIKEIESYGVKCLRKSADGCAYVGNWQAKAMLKQAASRIGLFVAKIGTKGDLAEMGRVRAIGKSLNAEPTEIRLMGPDGKPYKGRRYERFFGHPTTRKGETSIVHDSEIVPPGCQFSFELRVPHARFTADQIAAIFAAAEVVGIGSARALERGKFRVDRLDVTDLKPRKRNKS